VAVAAPAAEPMRLRQRVWIQDATKAHAECMNGGYEGFREDTEKHHDRPILSFG
jgi:hypothetical protein